MSDLRNGQGTFYESAKIIWIENETRLKWIIRVENFGNYWENGFGIIDRTLVYS